MGLSECMAGTCKILVPFLCVVVQKCKTIFHHEKEYLSIVKMKKRKNCPLPISGQLYAASCLLQMTQLNFHFVFHGNKMISTSGPPLAAMQLHFAGENIGNKISGAQICLQ